MNTRSAFGLDGKTVAVIGAGSGLGEAVALACGEAGAHVLCLDIDAEAAASSAESIRGLGAGSESAALDVRDAAAVERALERLADCGARLDGVVSTPGVNVRKLLLQYTSEEFNHVVGLNLGGTFNVLRAAGSVMERQRSGSIVIFSSIRSLVVEPGQGVYAATKAGIVQLVRTAAAELGPAGVRVNAMAPGVIDTPLTASIKADPDWYQAYASRSALGRWGKPVEVAEPTVYLLSDASSYVTGSVQFVDGGWTAIDGRFQPPGM